MDARRWTLVGTLLFLFLVLLYYSLVDSIKVIEQGTAMIVERYGRFKKVKLSGFLYMTPFIERPRFITWRSHESKISFKYGNNYYDTQVRQFKQDRIDLREQIMDLPMQTNIITRDNVMIDVHPMLLFKLEDPVRVAYQTYDLSHAVEKLVQTTLRSIIGDMGLDDTLASREEINKGLHQRVYSVCMNWGLKIIKTEILEILPGDQIQRAMHMQIESERDRRAMIITADGKREERKTLAEGRAQAAITVSKGEEQEKIIRAKGVSDAKLIVAGAEAEALKMVAAELKAFKGMDATQYMIGLKYIEAFSRIVSDAHNKTLIMPYEPEVYGSLAELS